MVDPGMRQPRRCLQSASFALKKERWRGTEPYDCRSHQVAFAVEAAIASYSASRVLTCCSTVERSVVPIEPTSLSV